MKNILALLLVCFFFIACESNRNQSGGISDGRGNKPQQSARVKIEYASAFDVAYKEGYKIVTIKTPWQGSTSPIRYVLRHESTPTNPAIDSLGQEIIIPLKKVVCNSTSQVVLLETLGVIDCLKGFPQTQYIYSPDVLQKVESGNIQEVGAEAQMNLETILALSPDVVMAFNMGRENRQLNKLEELGVPVVINADYMEKTILGRAEWLKFMSVFFDKEAEATVFFDRVVQRYDSLKSLASRASVHPAVFSGTLYGGSWYMPGGQNYGSKLIQDAGGQYLWSKDNSTGWLNLDFEVVYEKAYTADKWIGVGGFQSLSELRDADERYGGFDAFRQGQVYSYTHRVNSAGANDYFESGIVRPDIILADHIKMIHPDLMPDYELFYYKQLE